MTPTEAAKLARIVAAVDGGCSVCVRTATERLMRDFPEIEWKPLIRQEAAREGRYWVRDVESWTAAETDEEQEPTG